jgi:hypothetical protein
MIVCGGTPARPGGRRLATPWLCGSYRTVGSLGTRSTAHRNRWSCRAVIPKRPVLPHRNAAFQGTRPTLSRTMSFPVPFVSIRVPRCVAARCVQILNVIGLPRKVEDRIRHGARAYVEIRKQCGSAPGGQFRGLLPRSTDWSRRLRVRLPCPAAEFAATGGVEGPFGGPSGQ